MKRKIKYFIISFLMLILFNNLLYAHDPEMAYAVFKIFGVSFLLIIITSLLFAAVLYYIIKKACKDIKKPVLIFRYSSIFGFLIGILGLMADWHLASETNFFQNNNFIFIWFIGVILGEILGFILQFSNKK